MELEGALSAAIRGLEDRKNCHVVTPRQAVNPHSS